MIRTVNGSKKKNNWRLNINNEISTDEQKIANEFYNFFITKINKLKDGINKDKCIDPLSKLSKKMKSNHQNSVSKQ